MRVRAKICGITRLADAQLAVEAGCDALGFNFFRASRRYISPEQARTIIASVPPFVTCVGLFVNDPIDYVREAAATSGVGVVQFHGDESDAVCASSGLPFIKTIRISGPIDARALERCYPSARALLFDANVAGEAGGTGKTFDWSWWPNASSTPLVLAGGLTQTNVAQAIERTRPFAVDVCTGVEGRVKGAKDPLKLKNFMIEVQRAQRGN